ncbi:MAG: hypothetical protein IJ464_02095 [Alistipes sp.]|nr:hypothetical protein [Alistipes sp.]
MKRYLKSPNINLKKHKRSFAIGELYLFHPSDIECPAEESLWGIYDRTERNTVHLECSTHDLRNFDKWHPLPNDYHYARLATRSELRDYMYNLGCHDQSYTPLVVHLHTRNRASLYAQKRG